MSETQLSAQDLEQIRLRGADPDAVQAMIARLKKPAKFVPIIRAAGEADGLRRLDAQDLERLLTRFDQLATVPAKFTPMSGAASRMFAFIDRYLTGQSQAGDDAKVQQILDALDQRKPGPRLAFEHELDTVLRRSGAGLQERIEAGDGPAVIAAIVAADGLNYAALPKALIPFHRDVNGLPLTALHEHLREALRYAGGRLHLSISPQHQDLFHDALQKIVALEPSLAAVQVAFSTQAPSTDSVAIDAHTQSLVRDDDGQLVFFPAGHGALLKNVQDLKQAAVLRNVDNLPSRAADQQQVRRYHRALAVLLDDFNKQRQQLQNKLQSQTEPLAKTIAEVKQGIAALRAQGFGILLDAQHFDQAGPEEKAVLLRTALDRPVKIVGVVPNQGEPGGGPFVVDKQPPFVSIVEKDEIALEQRPLMAAGAFFNPVDLVIDPRDAHGQTLQLADFRDPERAFIVTKPYAGRDIRRLEHPGLWNGAMDGWTSLFVIMPIETFAPVKELVDLLRPAHQSDANQG